MGVSHSTTSNESGQRRIEHCELRAVDLTTGYWSKNGGNVVVHNDINLSFHSGELVAIIGQNGSGKSTLLRTICGFQYALGGDVLINHELLSSYSEIKLSRIFSVVFTEKVIIENMSVFDLIATGRAPYTDFFNRITESDFEIIRQSATDVGIEHLLDKNINQLSDGERQKVMIAKSIAQQTPIIILDEPTAFLDFPSKIELNKLLKRLCVELDKIIIMSTHDIEQALPFSDKVCIVTSESVECYTPENDKLTERLSLLFSEFGISYNAISGKFFVD